MAVFTLNKPLISEIFSDIYHTYLTNILAKFFLNWMSAFASSTFAENVILSIFFAICCFGRDQAVAIYQAIRYHEVVAYFIPTPYTAADSLSNPIVNGHLVMADGTIVELWTPTPVSLHKALVQPSSDFVVEVREEVLRNKEDVISEASHSDVKETCSSASDSDSDSESSYSTESTSPTLSATSDSSFTSIKSKSSRISAYDWAAEDDDDELPPLDFVDMVGCSTSSSSPAPVAVAPAPVPSIPRIQPRSLASRSLKLAVLEEDEEEEEEDDEDCYRYSASERDSRIVSMSAIRLIPSHTLRRTGRHWEKPFELIRYMPEASYEQRSAQYMYCFGVELLDRDL